ncbi:MAG: glycosyltransferase family 4 protein [Tepidisphaeraceae bacterium]|jgi:glycosyltransferase involved in cell wall biosynthesis
MADTVHRLLIEGWRLVPHSYAHVNQFQMLELLSRPQLALAHRDLPYLLPHWRAETDLFGPEAQRRLASVRPPAAGQRFDAVYRIAAPYDLRPSAAAPRTVVFGTAEFGVVPAVYMTGGRPLAEAHRHSSAVIVTPSQWSRRGLLRSGADEQRVFVVPHGVDTTIFQPLGPEQREQARRSRRWNDFVFLSVGSMTANKGMDLLLRAFAQVTQTHPQARLVVKGLDALYDSRDLLRASVSGLSAQEVQRIESRLHYLGEVGTYQDMALLYQMADAYVTPYRAEGFNLPVLEAAACGLVVICTAGGSTEDFVHEGFALRLASQMQPADCFGEQGVQLEPSLDHLIELMRRVIDDAAVRRRAREAGPAFVGAHFTWRHAVDRLLDVLFPEGAAQT